MGISRSQILVLAMMIFLVIALIGCAMLIALGKIVP